MHLLIKIIIVDDHQLIREAWTAILANVPHVEVVGAAESTAEAVQMTLKHRPEIVLMDINLKESNGFDATEQITNTLPKTRIIGLSLHDDVALVKKFLAKGASGYLSKNTSKEELLTAIDAVMKDELYLGMEIREKLNASSGQLPQSDLTGKEIEIVQLIGRGLTSREIADQLFVSVRTIETHRYNILKKLNIPNAAQLSSWAKEKGYL